VEDCWLADPRLLVRYPAGKQRLAIHPGSLTDPVQTLRNITATAETIDDFVLAHHGFNLSDLAEVALQYCDQRLHILRPSWPAGPLDRDAEQPEDETLQSRVRRIGNTPVALSEAEVAAASPDDSADEWIVNCEAPGQAAAAWEWATRPSAELQVNLAPGAQLVGPVLAVQVPGGKVPVPAALVIGALSAAAAALAWEAASDPAAQQRMQQVTERRMLGIFGNGLGPGGGEGMASVQTPTEVAGGPVLVSVPGSRHAFAVGIASGLDLDRLTRSVGKATENAECIDVSDLEAAGAEFDRSGRIFRAVVYGGPVHGPPPVSGGTVRIHVDDLVSAALDADQASTGQGIGRAVLWQFLDELSTLPGVEEMVAWDFTDIWQIWLSNGVLNPGGRKGIRVHPFTVPDQDGWARTAAWEPLEEVLAGAALPPSWEWPSARLDEPGQATLGVAESVFLLLAEPPLIMHAPVDLELGDLGLDPAFALGVADGVRLTVANHPDIAAAVSTADSVPVMIHVRIRAERPPDAPPDHVGVGFAASADPYPDIDLLFGPDWLEALAENAGNGHAIMGRALAEGLGRALQLPPDQCDAFFTAWCQAPPVGMLRPANSVLQTSFQGRTRLPRSHATAARAQRILAGAMIERQIPAAIYVEAGATGLCQEEILPAANTALAAVIADWSPEAMITVAGHLNDAYAERARVAGETAVALSAPWGARWRSIALDGPELALLTWPLDLLVELLMARQSAGTVNPDVFDIAEAADLAAEAVRISLYLSAARSGLQDLAILVDDHGRIGLTDTPPEPSRSTAIDLASYRQADHADRLRLRPAAPPGDPLELRPAQPRQRKPFPRLRSLSAVPGTLLKADKLLKDTSGTGLDGILAVLGTAVTWTAGDDSVVQVTRTELAAAAVQWAQLPQSEIEAALSHLILTPAQLQSEELRYWEQERRRYRLATRPLIALGTDQLLLIPRRIEATQGMYAGYMADGRLPWHSSEIPGRVRDAFVDYRKKANRDLERAVHAVVDGLALPYQGNIEQHHAAPFGLELTGEIDVLIADPRHSRMWVCEVKDVSAAVSPVKVADRARKFLSDDGYISQLLRCAREVQANAAAAARLVGAPDPDRTWRVVPLMVTRRVEPAAFAESPAIPFVVVEDLAATIQHHEDPLPGHIEIKDA
jgi:hypothetical protein